MLIRNGSPHGKALLDSLLPKSGDSRPCLRGKELQDPPAVSQGGRIPLPAWGPSAGQAAHMP